MPTINTAAYYKNEDFSDIVIAFGSDGRRRVKAHKFILCGQSDYFARLCGPKTPFAEGTQKVVELKDDEWYAVEAMLEWIYAADYAVRDDLKLSSALFFHIEVAKVADKYMLPDLAIKAVDHLRSIMAPMKSGSLAEIFDRFYRGNYDRKVTDVLNRKLDENLHELLKRPALTRLLDQKPGLEREILTRQAAFSGKLVQQELRWCETHQVYRLIRKAGDRTNCCKLADCREGSSMECWLTKEHVEAINDWPPT